MKNFDKLIELIDKKTLSEEEKTLLDSLLNEDVENRTFFETYKKLGKAFFVSKHLTIDELGDYVLIKNGFEPQSNKNLVKISLFDEHLRRCERCREEMKFFNREFSDVENFVNAQFDNPKESISDSKPRILNLPRINYSRYVFSLTVIIILCVSLIITSKLSESKYYKLATIRELSEMSNSRGRSTTEFEMSIKAIEDKDYQKAIDYLKKDIELNKNDQTIFYSYYLLGLTYLESAESSTFGLFPKFDKTSAKLALDYLTKTIELNNSGRFQNINLDSYFYAAKAALMLENTMLAKQFLQIVINEKGAKLNEAAEILSKLN